MSERKNLKRNLNRLTKDKTAYRQGAGFSDKGVRQRKDEELAEKLHSWQNLSTPKK